MTPADLASIYRQYIACLNTKDWSNLGRFVHDEVSHNGKRIGLAGYRQMLENDYASVPDLHFNIELLVAEPLCREPAAIQLFAKSPVSGAGCRRAEGFVRGERLLCVQGRTDRRGPLCHRQGRHRGAAVDSVRARMILRPRLESVGS